MVLEERALSVKRPILYPTCHNLDIVSKIHGSGFSHHFSISYSSINEILNSGSEDELSETCLNLKSKPNIRTFLYTWVLFFTKTFDRLFLSCKNELRTHSELLLDHLESYGQDYPLHRKLLQKWAF